MTFKESDLQFRFSKEWNVRPFDDHRFYRWSSGLGYRGVDFVGIFQEELFLIEVKNYRRRKGMPDEDALQAIRQEPEAFISKMVEKVEDSLKLIRAVNDYYRRRFWYKWFSRQPEFLQRLFLNRYFWHRTYELGQDPNSCRFVLWLDSDQPAPVLSKEIEKALMGRMQKEVCRVEIISRRNNPYRESLSIVK